MLTILLSCWSIISCKKADADGVYKPITYLQMSENAVIPAAIVLPENYRDYRRIETVYATGVQRYKARVKVGTTQYEWVLVGPSAALYDSYNKAIGSHGVGPHWTFSTRDSIFAEAFNPARTAPATEANSIDWLLLQTSTTKIPTGRFAEVNYVQRISTKGGKAPVSAPVSLTDTVNVPYSAVYRFSARNY